MLRRFLCFTRYASNFYEIYLLYAKAKLKYSADTPHCRQLRDDHAVAYGGYLWTERADKLFEVHFGSDIKVGLTFSGSGAMLL